MLIVGSFLYFSQRKVVDAMGSSKTWTLQIFFAEKKKVNWWVVNCTDFSEKKLLMLWAAKKLFAEKKKGWG